MLDTPERLALDSTGLLQQLEALPGSFSGVTRVFPAPHGVLGFGEGALAAEFARAFMDAEGLASGTLFILAGGLDFGQAEAAALLAEASGAQVVRLGHASAQAAQVTEEEATLSLGAEASDSLTHINASPLSSYHYALALAHSTGNAARATAAEDALSRLRDQCRSAVPSDENPAKRLAWNLWTRTPLLIPASGFQAQTWAWQDSLSRLAKSLSVPVLGSAIFMAASGFEARHESGDALVALFLGGEDESLRVARALLETRVDEVIEVPTPERDSFAANLALWYLSCWVGAYLALLYGQDPKDTAALEEVLGVQLPL